MTRDIRVRTDRSFDADEYIELMTAIRWADPGDYDPTDVRAALEAYHFIGHVRDEIGVLVGYVAAFGDGVFNAFVGELAVHPSARGRGVGARLLEAVEAAFPGVPVFILAFRDSRGFFLRNGYTPTAQPVEVLAKLNARGDATRSA